MELVTAVIVGLMGAAVGSFLNVCIDRLPRGKSLLFPPSHCESCQHRLAPLDLIPVLSYLWLRGRCRYCGAAIPRGIPLVEGLTAAYFIAAFARFGLSATFFLAAFWGSIFLVIMGIDFQHKLILNKVTYPSIVLGLIVLGVDSLWPGTRLTGGLEMVPRPSILSGLIGGGVGFVFLLIPALLNPRGMGVGDVKMAALIGLVVGFPMALIALGMGAIGGGLVAIVLLALKLKKRKEAIPFGPFLSLATMITLLWGNQVLEWYAGRFF